MNFYVTRFNLFLSEQDKDDLVAFLRNAINRGTASSSVIRDDYSWIVGHSESAGVASRNRYEPK